MEKGKEEVFASRLRQAMQAKGMKAVKLCAITGIQKADISHYRNGYYKPGAVNILKLAKALDCSPEWLSGDDVPVKGNISPVRGPMLTINILSLISCGNGTYNDGEVVDTITLPAEMFAVGKEYFGMYADGDSMVNAGISPGDLLIFERTDVPSENKIGAFCIDNTTALCKRYKSGGGQIFLLSANDNYAPILVDPQNTCFRCVGLLRKIMKNID